MMGTIMITITTVTIMATVMVTATVMTTMITTAMVTTLMVTTLMVTTLTVMIKLRTMLLNKIYSKTKKVIRPSTILTMVTATAMATITMPKMVARWSLTPYSCTFWAIQS